MQYMQGRNESRRTSNARQSAARQLLQLTQNLLEDELAILEEARDGSPRRPILASQDENACCIYLLQEILSGPTGYDELQNRTIKKVSRRRLTNVFLPRLLADDARLADRSHQST